MGNPEIEDDMDSASSTPPRLFCSTDDESEASVGSSSVLLLYNLYRIFILPFILPLYLKGYIIFCSPTLFLLGDKK